MSAQLMTHFYFGDPTKEFSIQLAQTLVQSGADILEIGIPYTDPVCDGEVFQRSCKRALAGGTLPLHVFAGITKLRQQGITVPIYITSYIGPVFALGYETFIKKAHDVGAQGIIIPDIPLEEQQEMKTAADRQGISIIQFATPYSTEDRLKEIIAASTDFIYCVSAPGVTGSGGSQNMINALIKRVKRLTNLPIFVGFGISTPMQVREIVDSGADGVIVGSAIARLYEPYLHKSDYSLEKISSFTRVLKGATIQNI